ncbi:GTPase HflX [Candidatus Sumerlaeota bacterium]|nr:GTPase HflX [Candidatus Sumerlaeota bacterium]
MSRAPAIVREEEERVFLVGLQTGSMKRSEAEASLEELHRLAESTTGVVSGSALLHVRTPKAATFIPEGQVSRLAGEISDAEAATAILDIDISPAQQHNLESRWGVKLLNRSELILDIFARRAHTSDGKLQIELAQHRYRLPRLRGRGIEMSRLAGGIGIRGPGEMKLEADRRAINNRIHTLEQKIARLKRQRETQRARREASAIPVVALVGYTNAGKSTMLNALTDAEAFVEDKLFATLDTTTRRCRLPSGRAVLFTDTVGFINRLPTQLFAAFRATLEEVLYADIMLHVVDATSPHFDKEIEVTRNVLKELGAGSTPILTAWNKIDALGEEGPDPLYLERRLRPSVSVSALQRIGLDRLLAEVQSLLDQSRPMVWLRFDYKNYRELNRLQTQGTIHETVHLDNGIYVHASLPSRLLKRYEEHRRAAPPAPVAQAEN